MIIEGVESLVEAHLGVLRPLLVGGLYEPITVIIKLQLRLLDRLSQNLKPELFGCLINLSGYFLGTFRIADLDGR